jgi:hypothetical protein
LQGLPLGALLLFERHFGEEPNPDSGERRSALVAAALVLPLEKPLRAVGEFARFLNASPERCLILLDLLLHAPVGAACHAIPTLLDGTRPATALFLPRDRNLHVWRIYH